MIKLLQTLNEINASFQKLLSGNEKCDEDSDDVDRQHDPYVSAMLCRRHKNIINLSSAELTQRVVKVKSCKGIPGENLLFKSFQ